MGDDYHRHDEMGDERKSMLCENNRSKATIINNGTYRLDASDQHCNTVPIYSSLTIPDPSDTRQKLVYSICCRGILAQCTVTLAVIIAGTGCGIPIGYSAVLLPQLKEANSTLPITEEIGSWIASVHSMATPLGSFLSGYLMEYFGRKKALQIAMLPLLFGWLLIATATQPMILIAGRILAGFAVGSAGAPSQVIISENSEPRLRGILLTSAYVGYAFGILVVYTTGSFYDWRTVAVMNMFLPLLSIAIFLILPETPTWLVRHGYSEKALSALKWLRSSDIKAEKEFQLLQSRINEDSNENNNNNSPSTKIIQHDPWYKTIARPEAAKPLLIIGVFSFIQIFSGTYMIVYYAVEIISQMGDIGIDNTSTAILTAVIRLISTGIAIVLIYFIGRRPLALFSATSSGVCSLALGVFLYNRQGIAITSYDLQITVILLIAYIAGQSFGIMPLFGILIGELAPANLRGVIGGVSFGSFNGLLFISIKLFPLIKSCMGIPVMFIMFGLSGLIGALIIYLVLPETKSKTLAEIEDYFLENKFLWIRRNRIPLKA